MAERRSRARSARRRARTSSGDLVEEPIHYENGHISPATGPGLGVTLDEASIDRYSRT
jgi:L-alanine-DL-glutamate epimerase-like enolase superfamily enzyme